MKAIRKDFVREIRHTLSRFLSILILVSLAVAFLSGLRSTAPDMKNTCDVYLDDSSFMDIQILSTLGLTTEDLALLKTQPGIRDAEGAYVVDAYAHTEALDIVAKVYSMPENLNQVTVLEGHLPQNPAQCVVDPVLLNRLGLEIGDRVEFLTEGDLEDAILPASFTITGVVRSPLYISPERGSSTLGTGQVGAFAYLPREAFDMDFYTTAYLTVEGAQALPAFSDAYNDLMDDALDRLEPVGEERAQLRRESLVDEGNEKLADAQQELDEAKADAAKELSDAWAELTDARQELDDGWAELADAKETLASETADAQQEIADAEVDLADALTELMDGEGEYADGKAEYEDGLAQYEDGLAEYHENQELLTDGRAEYHEGFVAYEDGKAALRKNETLLEEQEKTWHAGKAAFDQLAAMLLPVPGTEITTPEALGSALLEEGEAGGPVHIYVDTVLSGIQQQAEGLRLAEAKLTELEAAEAQLTEQIAVIEAQLEAMGPDEGGETTPPVDPEPENPEQGGETAPPVDPEPENPEQGGETTPPVDPETAVTLSASLLHAEPAANAPSRAELEATLAALKQQLALVQAGKQQLLTQTHMESPEALRATLASLEQLPKTAAEVRLSWEQLSQGRALLDQGQAALAEGKSELEHARHKLTAARQELDDADRQLEEGKAELDDAKAELDDASQQLTDARTELDDGWAEYYDGEAELADARQELPEKIADAKAEIADAEVELKDGERKYADGLAEYRDGKAEAEEKIADAEDEIADARRKIADIGDSEWYILDRDSNPGYLGYGQDADRMANLASVFPVLFFLVAALVCLTTMTRMVEEQRVQIGCLKALGYSRWAISRKYLGYGFLPALLGGILGLAIGFTLFPKMIFTAYQIMYDVPDIRLSVYPGISALSLVAAIGCTTISSLAACMNALRETPAALMRPRAPKAGKRVLLEYIRPLWRRMSFNHKVTARNLLRYQKRFWMTVIGIGGCTALIIAGFGLRSSLLDTMNIQYDEIFHYTAQLAVSENLLDSERQAIDAYIADSDDITGSLSCRLGNVTAESDTYSTGAYLDVVDPEKIDDFVTLRTYKSHEPLTIPDDGVIIDKKLSELLDVGPGDTFTVDGDGRVEVQVAAVTEHYLAHFIYLSPAYYEEVYQKPALENAYLLNFTSSDSALCDAVFTDMMNLHGVMSANRMLNTRDTYTSAMERIDFVVVIVILSAAALALVVLYNLSNINITERKRELATIRVLGFYDGEVSAYVNRENAVLTVFGILFGILAGRFLHVWLVKSVEIDMMMFGRETDPWAFLWAALLTALFSAIVALLSHRKMKKIDMVESLKSAE